MTQKTMKAMQVQEAGGDFVEVDLPVPDPGRGEVRIRVEACGICHSDAYVKEGQWPELELPRVPGHEVVGVIDALGEGVEGFEAGERVGVGWHGGHCFHCNPCRRGDFILCENGEITGITHDGGYAEYMVTPWEALARVPEELESTAAAPLLCAGITTFNALRNSGARAGDLVAVLGIGGLGHLALQYASAMGFATVALSRGPDKEELADEMGADLYIDTEAEDPAEALQEMGGARVILSTAPDIDAITAVLGGLGPRGELIIVGVDQGEIPVSPMQLVSGAQSVRGWPSGHAMDSEEALEMSALTGIEPEIEVYPLSEANEAYKRMIEGEARFRVVLTP
jgi:D-arabinose 1-dehydrogenase-like Zn-dependent alcohol dehydrogenase